METQKTYFEHDPELNFDQLNVAQHGASYREGLRFLPSLAEYRNLPTRQHWNESVFILLKAGAEIPDGGIDLRARNEDIPKDNTFAFVAGKNLYDGGTVIDIKAGYYKMQSETQLPSYIGYFGKDPSLLVYARARADGAKGRETVGPWHLKGWIGFRLTKMDTTFEDDFGQPYVVRMNQGVEEELSIDDPLANDLKAAVDEVALACLDTRQIRARTVGTHTLQVLSEHQLAS